MIDILIIIFFSELIILLAWYMLDSVIDKYRLYKINKTANDYEKDVYAPLNELEPVEEVFDEGYVRESKAYEARIAQMKYELDNGVEIMTDEQELEQE